MFIIARMSVCMILALDGTTIVIGSFAFNPRDILILFMV